MMLFTNVIGCYCRLRSAVFSLGFALYLARSLSAVHLLFTQYFASGHEPVFKRQVSLNQ
jgi:hypothetical protein